jgi:DNA-binding MarR family transcriptional regulator
MPDPAPQIGYLVKAAQAALHARMEEALRPLGLTVSHYSSLRLLHDRPGISAAELARAAFVTRQSMNSLLQTLLERGLVERQERATTGRALPTRLSIGGATVLRQADVVVDAVEAQMLATLAATARRELGSALKACMAGLEAGSRLA